MAIINYGNYSFQQPPFQEGDTVIGGNYSQLVQGTVICPDIVNLTIIQGNFINCVAQPTWTIQGGNWSQIDFAAMQAAIQTDKAAKIAFLQNAISKMTTAFNSAHINVNISLENDRIIITKNG